jgi:hypothetical protein
MTEQVQLACRISSTDPVAKIGLEIWLDDAKIYNSEHVFETVNFSHDFADEDGDHVLRFVMKNKTHEHTQIDANGNIVKDSCICIDDLSFDEIELGQIVIDKAVYEHNFNGTGDPVTEKFYGQMGCNGTVTMAFTTPVYLWLLENL